MKWRIIPSVSILAVAVGVGWTLSRHAETSVGLQQISLVERSEHSEPGPAKALAGIRIRLSRSDFRDQLESSARDVPQISVAAE